MISKTQYIDSITHDIQIMRHLATKIEPSMLDYRPSDKQRTTLELMQYLGHIFDTAVDIITAGTTDGFMAYVEKAPKVTLENFDSVMEAQAASVRAKIEAMSDEFLNKEMMIFNYNAPASMHLLNILKWASAYKMQLFLYIKANGKHDIGTSNLWGGMDMPPKN